MLPAIIPQIIQKRLIKFLLKRTIGQFLEHELDLEQLDVELGKGWVQLKDLSLDTEALNSFLPAGLAIRIHHGSIGATTASIPWRNIWTANCELNLENIFIYAHIVSPYNDGDSTVDRLQKSSLVESVLLNDSLHIAGDFIRESKDEPGERLLYEGANDPGSEGLNAVASLIEHITSRIQISAQNVIVRLFKDVSSSECFEFHIPLIHFEDETPGKSCNEPSISSFDNILLPFESIKSLKISQFFLHWNGSCKRKVIEAVDESVIRMKIKRPTSTFDFPRISFDFLSNEIIVKIMPSILIAISQYLENISHAQEHLSQDILEHEVEEKHERQSSDEISSVYFDAEPAPFGTFQQVGTTFTPTQSPRPPRLTPSPNDVHGKDSHVKLQFLKAKLYFLQESDEESILNHLKAEIFGINVRAKMSSSLIGLDITFGKVSCSEWISPTEKRDESKFSVPLGRYYPMLQFSEILRPDVSIEPFRKVEEYCKGIKGAFYAESSSINPMSADLNVKIRIENGFTKINIKTQSLIIGVDGKFLNRLKNIFPAPEPRNDLKSAQFYSSPTFAIQVSVPAIRFSLYLIDVQYMKTKKFDVHFLHEEWFTVQIESATVEYQKNLTVYAEKVIFGLERLNSPKIQVIGHITKTTNIASLNVTFPRIATNDNKIDSIQSVSDFQKSDSLLLKDAMNKFCCNISHNSHIIIEIFIPCLTSSLDKPIFEQVQKLLNVVILQKFIDLQEQEVFSLPFSVDITCEHISLTIKIEDELFYLLDIVESRLYSGLTIFGKPGEHYIYFDSKDLFITEEIKYQKRALVTPLRIPERSTTSSHLFISCHMFYDTSLDSNVSKICAHLFDTAWNYGKFGNEDEWSFNDIIWITNIINFVSLEPPMNNYTRESVKRYTIFTLDVDDLSFLISSKNDVNSAGNLLLLNGRLSTNFIQDDPVVKMSIHFRDGTLSIRGLSEYDHVPLTTHYSWKSDVLGYFSSMGYYPVIRLDHVHIIYRITEGVTDLFLFEADSFSINVQKDSLFALVKRLSTLVTDSQKIDSTDININFTEDGSVYFDVLNDIEENAFSISSPIPLKASSPIEIVGKVFEHDLRIVDDFYNVDRMDSKPSPISDNDGWKEIEGNLSTKIDSDYHVTVKRLQEEPLFIDDNFFDNSQKESDTTLTPSVLFHFKISVAKMYLGTGCAFPSSRIPKRRSSDFDDDESTLTDAAIEIFKTEDGFLEMKEEDGFESIDIRSELGSFLPPSTTERAAIFPDDSVSVANDRSDVREKLFTNDLITAISVDVKSFDLLMEWFHGSLHVSSTSISAQDVEIIDHLPSSVWNKFLTHLKPESFEKRSNVERETGSNMVSLKLDAFKTEENRSEIDHRLKFHCAPLRLHVDQDAVLFLVDFFSYNPEDSKPPKQNDKSRKSTIYFQKANFDPIRLKVDYKPKKLDYSELQKGNLAEWANLFHLEGAEIQLSMQCLAGISGWEKLSEALKMRYVQELTATQLPNLAAGITPIRTLVNLGTGLKELILVPMEQLRKDGKILRGIRQGAERFAGRAALEGVKLSTKLVVGAQGVLERADSRFVPEGHMTHAASSVSSSSSLSQTRKLSKFSEQPKDVSAGLSSAYETLKNSWVETQTLLAIPVEYENSSSIRKVANAAPIAIIHPLVGVSEALRKTLLGVQNSIDPQSKTLMEEKYKRPTTELDSKK